MVIVKSNGSKWQGEPLDAISDLINVLRSTPLDPKFEEFGNFIMPAHGNKWSGQRNEAGERIAVSTGPLHPEAPGALSFWGNFSLISHVFNVTTDEPDLIDRLTKAIRQNQATPHYVELKKLLPSQASIYSLNR